MARMGPPTPHPTSRIRSPGLTSMRSTAISSWWRVASRWDFPGREGEKWKDWPHPHSRGLFQRSRSPLGGGRKTNTACSCLELSRRRWNRRRDPRRAYPSARLDLKRRQTSRDRKLEEPQYRREQENP
ncbi:hypothetical protein QQP08_023445 [Theobroma cacao]|nr:hypothetical protein QQP08_023445 [Theobroma cacao]